jgi:two-component system response regulator FixJ
MREAREARSETVNRYQELTPRQRDVARHLAAGMSAKETAQRLEMSPKTVEVHRGHILKKMGVSTTVELVHLLQQIQVAFPER